MARTPKKTVYERKESIVQEIKATEEKLNLLKQNLKEIDTEIDNMEMHQLFSTMREQGFNINEAMSLLIKQKEECES